MKICTKCKADKPLEEFSSSYCKLCTSAYNAAYHRANPEKSRQTSKKYDKMNRDKKKVHKDKYNKNNPEKVKGWSRRKNRKREALKKNNGHSPYSEKQVLDTYGTDCHLCQTPIDLSASRQVGKPGWKLALHIDHFIPISKGGPDTLENVRPSHGRCNIVKNAHV